MHIHSEPEVPVLITTPPTRRSVVQYPEVEVGGTAVVGSRAVVPDDKNFLRGLEAADCTHVPVPAVLFPPFPVGPPHYPGPDTFHLARQVVNELSLFFCYGVLLRTPAKKITETSSPLTADYCACCSIAISSHMFGKYKLRPYYRPSMQALYNPFVGCVHHLWDISLFPVDSS